MEKYMNVAIKEAKRAFKRNEVPIGAVIVKNNKIIAKSSNTRQKKYNVLGHAEINCVLKASKKQKDWRLDDCIMYVTLEPCEMCKKVIIESRISKVYYLLEKKKEINKNNTIFEQTNDCTQKNFVYKEVLTKFFKNLRD